jgi:hypothetical protein
VNDDQEVASGVAQARELGFLALHDSLCLNLDEYRQFLEVVSDDHGGAVNAIQTVFVDASRAAGVPFGAE